MLILDVFYHFLMIPYFFISSMRWFPIFTESAAALSPPAAVSFRYFKMRSAHAIGSSTGYFLRYGYLLSSFLRMETATLKPYSRLSCHSYQPRPHPASYYCCACDSYIVYLGLYSFFKPFFEFWFVDINSVSYFLFKCTGRFI